jgi:glycosyltransferase involved in cell wall biosynthesis
MINIITCVWNAENYIVKCIDSAIKQNNQNFHMYIIDDVSSDNSINTIKNKINDISNITLIQNKEKKYKLKNFDDLISNQDLIKNDDIIIELDGDDWFADSSVIDTIYETYDNTNILISNSKFVYCNGKIGFSNNVNISNIRQSPFMFSHLRSWKASLWRSINKKYFIDPRTNDYFKITADMAYSFPMLEMAGQDKYKHIPKILLVYNDSSPFNDHKAGSGSGGRDEQILTEKILRNLQV